jgi:hypothetical protein
VGPKKKTKTNKQTNKQTKSNGENKLKIILKKITLRECKVGKIIKIEIMGYWSHVYKL